MITPCKTLGVFVYSRLLPCTSVCIDMCETSLGVYALMFLNAQNILLHTVCVCFSFARHSEDKSPGADDFLSKAFPR